MQRWRQESVQQEPWNNVASYSYTSSLKHAENSGHEKVEGEGESSGWSIGGEKGSVGGY